LFLGGALVVFEDAGIVSPSPEAVARLAGYLALPGGVSFADELRLQTWAPIDFLMEHQRRREWGSGVYAAVR
jgi:hypothetical protein